MILFFGPAGAGKSVQGQLLAKNKGWQWVSSGQLLRETANPEILAELQKGNLISSDKMYDLFSEALAEPTDVHRLILDGFPRKREQAEWLVGHLKDGANAISMAIVMDVAKEELLKRIEARGRADDTPEAVDARLKIYHEEVDPILTYLEENHIPVVHINGIGAIDEIQEKIMNAVTAANIA
jgi:adenylate kinase